MFLFQKLVRLKDADEYGYCECVSCGIWFNWKEGDGGHFISKSHSSYWALREENVHPQCKGCNGFGMKFGTAMVRYTNWMCDFYGRDFVEEMIATKKNMIKIYKKEYETMTKEWLEEIRYHLDRIGEK